MTQSQFNHISENFINFVGAKISFKVHSSDGEGKTLEGHLKGIGQGLNAEHLIVTYMGSSHSIYWQRAKLVKQ